MFSSYVGQLTFKSLLEEYADNSSRIKLEYKDPYLYPTFVEKYAPNGEAIPVESVIVESGDRYKVIQSSDMVTLDFDTSTYQQYVKSIDIEPRITNAINYVTSPNSSVVYAITGSNEAALSDSLKNQIGLANFDVKEVNLLTSDVPEDCTILFATQPSRDWTEEEAKKVLEFLQNDGRAIFSLGYVGIDYPNLSSVLQNYGVDLGKYVIIEGSADNYILNNPTYLIPNAATHAIMDPLKDDSYNPLIVQASGLETLSVKKTSTTIEPLLTTSNQSYGKTNSQATTISKEAEDASGPFNVAVAITDSFYTQEQHTTKVVAVAAASFLDENINYAMGGANWSMLINSLNWLQDKEDTIYIAPKTPDNTARLSLTALQVSLYALLSVIVIPAFILLAGLFVWLRRRHS
jgi:hypothetical protein